MKVGQIRHGDEGEIHEIRNGDAGMSTTNRAKGWVDVSCLDMPIREKVYVLIADGPVNKRETPDGRSLMRIKAGSRISVPGWRSAKKGELWAPGFPCGICQGRVFEGGRVMDRRINRYPASPPWDAWCLLARGDSLPGTGKAAGRDNGDRYERERCSDGSLVYSADLSDRGTERAAMPGDQVSVHKVNREFGVPVWRNRKFTVPESALMEITVRNRFRYFSAGCAVCGKRISGRPAEYPYYRKFGDRVAFLCDFCDELERISLRE